MGGWGETQTLLGRDKLAFPMRIKLFLLPFASLLRKCLLGRQVENWGFDTSLFKECM